MITFDELIILLCQLEVTLNRELDLLDQKTLRTKKFKIGSTLLGLQLGILTLEKFAEHFVPSVESSLNFAKKNGYK